MTKCAWCGKEVIEEQLKKAFTFTHEGVVNKKTGKKAEDIVETVHSGECDKQYMNSRGLNK